MIMDDNYYRDTSKEEKKNKRSSNKSSFEEDLIGVKKIRRTVDTEKLFLMSLFPQIRSLSETRKYRVCIEPMYNFCTKGEISRSNSNAKPPFQLNTNFHPYHYIYDIAP